MLALKDQTNAAILDDFLDAEVLDKRGDTIGTLECYWESASGTFFLGIKITEQEIVRVVPGSLARLDERHACILVGCGAATIRSGPPFDCDKELKGQIEHAANKHFGV